MKNLFLTACLVAISIVVQAKDTTRKPASTFERLVPCSSHYIATSGYFQLEGVSLKTATEACSLGKALEEGKEVCEGNSFAYLRPNGGKAMSLIKSIISRPTCTESEGDFSCETKVIVDCK